MRRRRAGSYPMVARTGTETANPPVPSGRSGASGPNGGSQGSAQVPANLERALVEGSKVARPWLPSGLPEFPGTPGRLVMLACRARHVPRFWPPHWEVVVVREPGAVSEVWERCSVFVVWPGCEGAESVLESLMMLCELGARAPVLLAGDIDAAGGGRGQPPLGPAHQGLSVRRVLRREHLALSIHEGVARTILEGFCQGVVETFNPPDILRSAVRFLCHQDPPWSYQGLLGEPECGKPAFVRFVKALAPRMGCSESHLRRQARAVGISLASLVDWTTLLQGVSLHQERLMPWTRIALRMGFSDHSAMSDHFKRTSGSCPRELSREPWRILMVQALQGVTECAGLAGEDTALDS
jgi:AraC-like DNA-binding protein